MFNSANVNMDYFKDLNIGLKNIMSEIISNMTIKQGYPVYIGSNKELAKKINKDLKTVQRQLSKLSKMKYIYLKTKRGHKGGIIVMVNKDIINYSIGNSLIMSEEEAIQRIFEEVFPTKSIYEAQNKYRTKEEIAKEKILKKRVEGENAKLNYILSTLPYPTWNFFEKLENPERSFKAYLISRMYNVYTLLYPKERVEMYKNLDFSVYFNSEQALSQLKGYDVLDEEFIGTSRFNTFLSMVDYLEENNINPLNYLTVQFDYIDYIIVEKQCKNRLPFVNTLLNDEAINRYDNQEAFYKVLKRNRMRTYSRKWYAGAKYPIIQALNFAYKVGKRDISSLEVLVEELEGLSKVSDSTKGLKEYFYTITEDVENSDLNEEEKTCITNYLTEQVTLYSRKNSWSLDQYLLAFPLQIRCVKQECELKKIDNEVYLSYIGNMNKLEEVSSNEYNSFIEKGKLLDFSLHGNVNFYRTIRTLADYRGIGINLIEFKKVLKKFGEEKIPLDKFGMLDINAIYKKSIELENVG